MASSPTMQLGCYGSIFRIMNYFVSSVSTLIHKRHVWVIWEQALDLLDLNTMKYFYADTPGVTSAHSARYLLKFFFHGPEEYYLGQGVFCESPQVWLGPLSGQA